MNKTNYFLLFICFGALACQTKTSVITQYEPRQNVGDILENPEIDTTDFQPCHEDLILQYYNFSNGIRYEGEKAAIIDFVNDEFVINPENKDNGFVTIRFIVNCLGKTGRFRVIELDNDYNETTISPDIVNQITGIVSRLDGWQVGQFDTDRTYDYYQYLTFKISNGRITDIMP